MRPLGIKARCTLYGEGVDQARHVVLDIGAACFDAFKSFKTEGFTLSDGDDTQGVGQARRYDQQTPQHLLFDTLYRYVNS